MIKIKAISNWICPNCTVKIDYLLGSIVELCVKEKYHTLIHTKKGQYVINSRVFRYLHKEEFNENSIIHR